MLDSGRIPRIEWTAMYIRAREKALTAANIVSGWKATGLCLLSAITVLDKLAPTPTPNPSNLQTPRQTSTLDLALLHSSPPDGTELRQASRVFNSQICNIEGLAYPVKRFSKRITQALEST